MEQIVYISDVLSSVCSNMKVQDPSKDAGNYFDINYEPGFNIQIIDSLIVKTEGGLDIQSKKYPLLAAVMPIPEKSGSGFLEVTFPRIVIAYYTKTGEGSEPVIQKYNSDGVFKTILGPCLKEFIKRLAHSVYTSQGDPDAYEYTSKHLPSTQPIGDGLKDFVDIIEISNLKTIIYSSIKSC